FGTQVLPTLGRRCPGLGLTIGGPQPPAAVRRLAQLPGVEVTGVVEQLEPCYQRAQVCVVSLRAGGGTRLKILEAMAYGRPVVSTRIGCQGLAGEKGRDILLADTPGEFSAEIMRLLHDAQLYAEVRSNARRLVEEQYDWSHAANRLLALHARLTGQSSLCG